MKLRTLVLAMTSLLGAGCMSMDQPSVALRIEPVLSVRHASTDAHSYYQLGRYYQGQSRLVLAEEAYLKALSIDERHVDTLNALGSLYAERGELERAAHTFENVTAMAPEAAYLHNNLGFAYYLLGRLDDAYVAVHKALKLDQSLQRGWDNIERIVDQHAPVALVEAVRQRRLDALPGEIAGSSANVVAEYTRVPVEPVLATAASLAEKMPAAPAPALASVETPSDVVEIPDVASLAACNATEAATGLPAYRLEISNGNGIRHFARKFSAQLDAEQIQVARITNHNSFVVRQTQVEYQPGFQPAACALLAYAGSAARLVPASKVRGGSDIRIVLGRDIVTAG